MPQYLLLQVFSIVIVILASTVIARVKCESVLCN